MEGSAFDDNYPEFFTLIVFIDTALDAGNFYVQILKHDRRLGSVIFNTMRGFNAVLYYTELA